MNEIKVFEDNFCSLRCWWINQELSTIDERVFHKCLFVFTLAIEEERRLIHTIHSTYNDY
ncbi:hypothetical protein HMPREF0620_0018 [Parascardovia denticolens DSM 10105 = JCM 12538]|uniref:Uncharacterized protein n=1 Tax=Parascardovia denticolens DSM 10105 = JCM 12538 TaxID=864564 RepID=E6JYF4_PARDN|nr:hypothetical protein HMPREF0620_0018 [Parascardovia denticolens DSM 10105 = JCM 12538]BAR04521.1 hypothetical protein PSDT_0002 [Parascardovia denticolens DSM 10105 = JCM 12538]